MKASKFSLDDHEIIIYGDELPVPVADLNWLLAAGAKPGKVREPVLQVSSVHAIFQAVRSGFGIGALPYYLAEEDPKLVEILRQLEGPRTNVYLVYPEDLRHSRRIIVLRDFLLKEAKRESRQTA